MKKPTQKLPKLTLKMDDQRKATARLREIVLYIAERCSSADRFGAIKLNKILAFADFTAFARYGRPITGLEYMRQKNGPVPRRMKPVLEQMKRTGEIAVQEIPVGRHVEHRVVPLRAANVDVLAPTDVAMINEVIALTWDKTGSQVSDFSHGRAWEVAGENGAPIPYEAALLADRLVPSAAQVARSRELNRKYAWE